MIPKFQPTHPLRGATRQKRAIQHTMGFQSTRPLRGATSSLSERFCATMISIHAPLTGRDGKAICYIRPSSVFQSTRPLRGATYLHNARDTLLLENFNPRAPYGARPPVAAAAAALKSRISIHAPLTGRDKDGGRGRDIRLCISIHAPLTGRDPRLALFRPHDLISIHAPLTGRDPRPTRGAVTFLVFQSTRPLRGATPLVVFDTDQG